MVLDFIIYAWIYKDLGLLPFGSLLHLFTSQGLVSVEAFLFHR